MWGASIGLACVEFLFHSFFFRRVRLSSPAGPLCLHCCCDFFTGCAPALPSHTPSGLFDATHPGVCNVRRLHMSCVLRGRSNTAFLPRFHEYRISTDTWRLVAKGLRKTGETVYDFGVAAENVTAEATEVSFVCTHVWYSLHTRGVF